RMQQSLFQSYSYFIVILIQRCEPVTSSVIFPFVIFQVRDTGTTGGDESKVGYYAGETKSTPD
ncbi:hypothetical protein BV22DRAFT_1019687, partial [Leucogyrophana mollusca]